MLSNDPILTHSFTFFNKTPRIHSENASNVFHPLPDTGHFGFEKTRPGKSHYYKDHNVFEKLRFQLFSVQTKISRRFQIPPACRPFSKSSVFLPEQCERWAYLQIEIKKRFQIPPAQWLTTLLKRVVTSLERVRTYHLHKLQTELETSAFQCLKMFKLVL